MTIGMFSAVLRRMNDAAPQAPVPLAVRPLTPQAFAPYGTVLAAPAGKKGRLINGGNAERFDLVGNLQLGTQGGRPMLALFRAHARRFPHEVAELERHALGSQAFVPLGMRRFEIVVARAGAAPASAAELSAFATDGLQGVLLAPGTWHHALLAVDAGDFVVLERRADALDCALCRLAAPVTVQPP